MDYERLFADYGIPTAKRTKIGINVHCPFCPAGASMNLGFKSGTMQNFCFKCGRGHSTAYALSLILGIPRRELEAILEDYRDYVPLRRKLNDREPRKPKKIELPGFKLSGAEKDYLLERRFSPRKLAEKYGIQGGGYGEWKNRIVIPIYFRGKLVSWTSRTILPDRQPRYKNLANELSIIDPKRTLFNIDNCRSEHVALLEGPFDVMRFGDDGICGFGITLTRAQVMLLSDRFKKVYVLFDAGRVARKKAWEYGMLLQGHGVDVFVADAFGDNGCKDAGEMSPLKMRNLKRELWG